MQPVRLAIAIAIPVLAVAAAAQEVPRHVVFTWQGDTGTTLTVNWQTFAERPIATRVYHDTVPREGIVEDYLAQTDGESFRIPGLEDRWIHRVQLTGLEPGGAVHLCAGDPRLGISREYRVRTIAHDDRPLRFVTGGDMGPGAETRALLRQAARTAPDLALVGGDVAYANGRLENVDLWDTWLTYWTEEMVRPDGFAIPLVLAIGNHEVDGGFGRTPDRAPFFFGFFGQDEGSYFARRFGSNLVFFVLDSGHVARHGGMQSFWLSWALKRHEAVPHKAAIYHVPLYPSHRAFAGEYSRRGREHWAPLFDRYDLSVAFENHDHTWKRSRPLRGNRVAEDGVLYLGDGCWGRPPRAVLWQGRWYLDRQATVTHFWMVDVAAGGMVYRAIDRRGRVFDVHPDDAPGAAAAAGVFAGLETHYVLPADAVRVDPLPLAADGTVGCRTAVHVHNTFGAPAAASVALREAPEGVSLAGAVGEVQVAAGDAVAIPVELACQRALGREENVVLTVRLVLAADGGRAELARSVPIPVGEVGPRRGP